MLRKAQEVIASGDVPAIVDYGIELDRTIKAENTQLEEVKEALRGVGETSLADRQTEKTVQIRGNLGKVTITYPADHPKLRSGVDILASEAGIPPKVFDLLFKKRVVVDFAEDFVKKVRSLDREDRELILNLIELQQSTPRVIWPK